MAMPGMMQKTTNALDGGCTLQNDTMGVDCTVLFFWLSVSGDCTILLYWLMSIWAMVILLHSGA